MDDVKDFAVIIASAMTGSLWPLGAAHVKSRLEGGTIVFRHTFVGLLFSVPVSPLLAQYFTMPYPFTLACPALIVSAYWDVVFAIIFKRAEKK